LPVNTAWDIGYNNTAIIYFQIDRNQNVRIIDFDAPVNRSLHDWIKHVKQKPYVYGRHWAPHDTKQHDYTTGVTRFQFARDLGFNFETKEVNGDIRTAIPSVGLEDGIERVMASFNKIAFDKNKCAYLIKSLETYHREYDENAKIYRKEPAKSWANHASDAFRYMCLVLPLHQQGMTEEDVRRGYQQAMWPTQDLPYPYNNDPNIFKGRW
jgi:phage terminase large subunit